MISLILYHQQKLMLRLVSFIILLHTFIVFRLLLSCRFVLFKIFMVCWSLGNPVTLRKFPSLQLIKNKNNLNICLADTSTRVFDLIFPVWREQGRKRSEEGSSLFPVFCLLSSLHKGRRYDDNCFLTCPWTWRRCLKIIGEVISWQYFHNKNIVVNFLHLKLHMS